MLSHEPYLPIDSGVSHDNYDPAGGAPGLEGNQSDQNKPTLTDQEAQALLKASNLAPQNVHRSKPSAKTVGITIGLILVILLVSYLAGAFKSGKSGTNSSTGKLGVPNQSNLNSSSGVTNQVNQDVKACSNPVNATLVC